jgi:DNA-binding NtrC family response regulator
MSGQKVAESARALRPHLPVLYTTGYAAGAVIKEGVADADFELLGKPYTLDALARKVRQAIDSGAPRS